MPTPSTRLRAVLQTPGGNLNTWGQVLNDQALALFDEAIAGVEKITLSGSTYTLSSANYATDQARNAGLIFQGSPTATVTVTVPAVEKVYVCVNQTAQTVNLGCGGTAASLAAGDQATVWCDGTDCGLGSISVGTVNGLITNAALSGTLPGQSGNAGKFLQTNGTTPLWADALPTQAGNAGKALVTNGTVASWTAPDPAGGADATITTATALTASSSVVQSVDMAANAQSVTLPDATTLSKGGRKYVVLNIGNRTFGVRSSGGTLLAVLPAGASAELHLRDNATAAGGWGVTGRGLEPALTLVDYTVTGTFSNPYWPACRLSDTLSLHFVMGNGNYPYVIAVDHAAGSVGAPVQIVAAAQDMVHCWRISATKALVQVGANHFIVTVSGTTCTVSAAATYPGGSNAFGSVTFSGPPMAVQLGVNDDLFVGVTTNGSQTYASAVDASGATPTAGATTALFGVAATNPGPLAIYRVSATTALVIYMDNSGTASNPWSIRARVLSVSGTTITVNADAGINDVAQNATSLPTCQLSASKYIVSYFDMSSQQTRAVAFTVSGTTVTAGTPLTVESAVVSDPYYTDLNANRFQPNLYPLSASTALLTWGRVNSSIQSRHVVLSESGGTLTKGAIVYGLWMEDRGGNFPQTASGFLAFSFDAPNSDIAVYNVTISGTALTVTGTFADGALTYATSAQARFGLSGGVYGVATTQTTPYMRVNIYHLFKFVPNAAPRYLGPLRLNDYDSRYAAIPLEVAPNKAAFFSGKGQVQPTASTDNPRLLVVEFAAS